MSNKTIGFIGLGLIGGSIAKALRRKHPEYRMMAYNRSKASLVAALADGTLNQTSDEIDSSFSECDFIFLCMPVTVNIACLEKLKGIISDHCIITDVGSVKTTIHQAVSALGMEKNFIGGHPMAGSEKTGYGAANDRLLENAYYIITPTSQSDPEKVNELSQIAQDTGALPIIIDYNEHDRATAAISHLPHVLAFSLVNQVRNTDNENGLMRQIAAGGFRDITRIASSSPDMWESICLENKGQLISAIETYKSSLSTIETAIKNNDGRYLNSFFEQARDYRDDMPTKMSGTIRPVFEIYVDIIDESGAIATLATILAANAISIKNIGIIHNREFQEGVLRIEFYQADAVEKAISILTKFNYVIHTR